ncbi:hypothetical protein ABK040_003691 [Willaertia magna]
MLQFAWDYILSHPSLLQQLNRFVIYTIFSFLVTIPFLLLDTVFKDSKFVRKFCLRPARNSPNWKEIVKDYALAIANILILFVLLYFLDDLIPPMDVESLPKLAPSFLTFVFECLIMLFCTDFYFYWLHRFFHTFRFLYEAIHKYHHKYIYTYAPNAFCTHPVEIWFAAGGVGVCSYLTRRLFNFHPLSEMFLPFYYAVHAILEHTGYRDNSDKLTFGILAGGEYHYTHHHLFEKNYAFYFPIIDKIFGTYAFYDPLKKDEE